MTIKHYIVFVGASARLSTELVALNKRISNAHVVAPAMGKRYVEATQKASESASEELFKVLKLDEAQTQPARLSLWMYEPTSPDQFERIWDCFGHSAWVETIPRDYLHKIRPTREYLERRINEILPLLHAVSGATYAQRKSSPLTLPLRNFTSRITRDLKGYWYNQLGEEKILKSIKKFKIRYSQLKSNEFGGYVDKKSLVFKPAKDTECHGKTHPTGSLSKSFTCGRFRYGVALFPGFHFDVSATKSPTIKCRLLTSSGAFRAVQNENRGYINIFPNDHLLPEN